MVDRLTQAERHDAVFHALGDSTRRRIVGALARGPHTIGELARPFPISLAAVSKHVKVLENARLVRRRVRGREHVCSLDPAALAGARDWIERQEKFWNERLDALEALLAEGGQAAPGTSRTDDDRGAADTRDHAHPDREVAAVAGQRRAALRDPAASEVVKRSPARRDGGRKFDKL